MGQNCLVGLEFWGFRLSSAGKVWSLFLEDEPEFKLVHSLTKFKANIGSLYLGSILHLYLPTTTQIDIFYYWNVLFTNGLWHTSWSLNILRPLYYESFYPEWGPIISLYSILDRLLFVCRSKKNATFYLCACMYVCLLYINKCIAFQGQIKHFKNWNIVSTN